MKANKGNRISRIIAIVAIILLFAGAAYAEILGNSKTKKYHTTTCKLAQKIRQENKVIFKNVAEAKQKGYAPCKTCSPDSAPAAGSSAPAKKK